MEFLYKKARENTQKEKESRIETSSDFGEARILVVGSGGGGNNTLQRLANIGIQGAELIAVNTDKQQLERTKADKKILIGYETTRGLGAGGYPEIGRQAALDAKTVLKDELSGADLVFVTAGLGGGTGTGSLPVIAEIAKDAGAVVVGAVTMPFKIERARIPKAREALAKLKEAADSVVVVDNNKLLQFVPDLPVDEAFGVADEILSRMVKGISETISIPSLINLDFADVRAVMRNTSGRGVAMIGLGEAEGRDRATEAVTQALENPLLNVDYRGATGALVHITGGPDLTLSEANTVGEIATSYLRDNANVIWGARIDPEYEKRLQVMVIMTGVSSPDIIGSGASIQVPSRDIKVPKRGPKTLSDLAWESPVRRFDPLPPETKQGIMAKLDIDYIL
ncbi:MAG: cell division protein FtsZ [Methanobacteriota archaeon]|nr:MAG: cell division protein FtsZ [Euryarchaeota archaeon]